MTFPYKLIDLTHALDSTIPTWNRGCGFNHDVHIDYSDCESEDGGYIPDGKGVTYNYQPTIPGNSYPLDDDLVLWFTKKLR